jgi:hypothetical protein
MRAGAGDATIPSALTAQLTSETLLLADKDSIFGLPPELIAGVIFDPILERLKWLMVVALVLGQVKSSLCKLWCLQEMQGLGGTALYSKALEGKAIYLLYRCRIRCRIRSRIRW